MNFSEALYILKNSMIITLIVITPILSICLITGFVIAIFQAVTSIQEMTLAYIPKIIIAFISLIFIGSWMIKTIVIFTQNLIKNIPSIIR